MSSGRVGNGADMFGNALAERLRSLADVLEITFRTENKVTTIRGTAIEMVNNGKKVTTRRVGEGGRRKSKVASVAANAITMKEATLPNRSLVGDV